MKKKVRKLAVFVSGDGSTLQAVIKAIALRELDMEIKLVISDNPKAFALIRAETAKINTKILTSTIARIRDEEILETLNQVDIDFVLLLHYQQLIGPKVLNKYTVINSYPSLFLEYEGKGDLKAARTGLQSSAAVTGKGMKRSPSEDLHAQAVQDLIPYDQPLSLPFQTDIQKDLFCSFFVHPLGTAECLLCHVMHTAFILFYRIVAFVA